MVLRWMAGNVNIEKDVADRWKPSKKKSIERIDGIVALIMAMDRASTQPSPTCRGGSRSELTATWHAQRRAAVDPSSGLVKSAR